MEENTQDFSGRGEETRKAALSVFCYLKEQSHAWAQLNEVLNLAVGLLWGISLKVSPCEENHSDTFKRSTLRHPSATAETHHHSE